MEFERLLVADLVTGLQRDPAALHLLIGPRQVGKSTVAMAVERRLGWASHVASADSLVPPPQAWIEDQWIQARAKAAATASSVLLVLDEVQRIHGWSDVVRRLWDEEVAASGKVRVLLPGSSHSLERSAVEHLGQRFVIHRAPHWSWPECRDAFGWNLDQWLFFGGYPGSAPFVDEPTAWKEYVGQTLVDNILARDFPRTLTADRSRLARRFLELASHFPAQVVTYKGLAGQLTDGGSATTLAAYLRRFEAVFLASGIDPYIPGSPRRRATSPKIIIRNNALISGLSPFTFEQALADPNWWGRLVENAVGAHLLNQLPGPDWKVHYWGEGADEVDYVISHGSQLWAVEVKSGRAGKVSGLTAFRRNYPGAKIWLVGGTGIPLEDFFGRITHPGQPDGIFGT